MKISPIVFIILAFVLGVLIGAMHGRETIKTYEICPQEIPYNQDLYKEPQHPLICKNVNDCILNNTAIGCNQPNPYNFCCYGQSGGMECTLVGSFNYKTKATCDNSTGRIECRWIE